LLKKTSNKYKLFEIQIVQDKTLQHLINLILEPLVEIKNDLHNYSYRSYRSAKQAVAYIKARLNIQIFLVNKKNEFSLLLPENHYILNSNIENFFCYISNQWLLKNIFLHLTLLLFITK
jgi:retron-type reverse transcriptase